MGRKNDLTELQLHHQQQMKEKRESIKQRKARTHRLIVHGAIAESFIENAASMTDKEFQQALLHAFGRSDDSATSHPQDSGRSPLRENPSEESCGSNPR